MVIPPPQQADIGFICTLECLINVLHLFISKMSPPPYACLIWPCMFNPLRLQYVKLRTKSQNRCDSCTYIYTYTDFAIEIWGFYRRLTDTLRYHYTRCSHASGLQLVAILQHVYQRKKSGVYSELSAVFGEFWKITIVGPSSIHRLAWNTTANYMDFLP